jgi:hypothetical protein
METLRSLLIVPLLSWAVACAASSKPKASPGPATMAGAEPVASNSGSTDGASATAGSGQPRDSSIPTTSPPSPGIDASTGVRAEPTTPGVSNSPDAPEIASACTADDFDGVDDPNRLAPGALYCLEGALFPGGYVTTNCSSDSDCPNGARCDGENCRQKCEADSDCRAPMICAMLDPFSSCQCSACARSIRM